VTSDTLHSQLIKNFRHKRLRRLFERGEPKLIRPDMVQTVREILFVLDNADTVEGLDLPGYRLHQLKGDRKGYLAMTVRANWRIVFRFASGNAYDVELIDYH
jgi:toxin HigB-1